MVDTRFIVYHEGRLVESYMEPADRLIVCTVVGPRLFDADAVGEVKRVAADVLAVQILDGLEDASHEEAVGIVDDVLGWLS